MRPPTRSRSFSTSVRFNSRTLGRVRRLRVIRVVGIFLVSIHAPWEGCDLVAEIAGYINKFQFTHPGKGATTQGPKSQYFLLFQFTHPGKGATQITPSLAWSRGVSIHAPWEGCDPLPPLLPAQPVQFQFTHPGKGATYHPQGGRGGAQRFNSRTLGRVRLGGACPVYHYIEFQFTHPGKGATRTGRYAPAGRLVSIHAPWEGCDRAVYAPWMTSCVFQFTHPGKGATHGANRWHLLDGCFNSRTLGRVRQSINKVSDNALKVSIHAPWEGCDG